MIRPAILLVLAAPTLAQNIWIPTSTVTYSLTWLDTLPGGGGNHNMLLEPGEGALFRLTVAFSSQNTTVSFTPPVFGYSSGTIRGLCAGMVDLVGSPTASAAGSWDTDPTHGYGVIPPWNIVGLPGNGGPIHAGAELANIQFGQFPMDPTQINPTNPITNIFSALWTPASYASRSINFVTGEPVIPEPTSSVLIQLSPTQLAAGFCPSHYSGSVSIPIIPAPASCLLLAPLLIARRHRSLQKRPP